MANMWYDKDTGKWMMKVPGTDRVIEMGGAEDEAMKDAYRDREKAFRAKHYYDRFKDYSGDHAKLFGADNSTRGSELFYAGPGHNWRYALQDRAAHRGDPFGRWQATGFYEGASSSIDPEWRALMLRRNNAIEDLARRGYSQAQLNAHLEGSRNILNEDPDWADYDRWRNEHGVSSNWFINAPNSLTGWTQAGNSGDAWGSGSGPSTIGGDNGIGNSGSAWGPSGSQQNRLFSAENEQMRKVVADNLKKKLFE